MNLGIFYNQQSILDDESKNTNQDKQTIHQFSKKQIMPGTFIGSVFIEGRQSYILTLNMNGRFTICPKGEPTANIMTCHLNLKKSILTIDWDKIPKNCEVKASYDYEVN